MTAGDEVTLTTDSAYDGKSDATTIYVGYPQLAAKVAAGSNTNLNPNNLRLLTPLELLNTY